MRPTHLIGNPLLDRSKLCPSTLASRFGRALGLLEVARYSGRPAHCLMRRLTADTLLTLMLLGLTDR